MMMALPQENVHHTLNSGPGVMNKSNRVHARIQEFLSGGVGGGGGVEARRPENSLDNVFFSHQLIYRLQRGSNGFITEGRRGSLQRGGGGPTSSRGWGCPKKPI